MAVYQNLGIYTTSAHAINLLITLESKTSVLSRVEYFILSLPLNKDSR